MSCFSINTSKAIIYWVAALVLTLGMLAGSGLSANPSRAQENASGAQQAPTTASTRIVVDQETGSFTFIIDGKPIARLDADGLEVLGDITYGGFLIDGNAKELRKLLEAASKPSKERED